jgi:FKBP-type peptidyl-prolyl cis-trans isomerase FkpA
MMMMRRFLFVASAAVLLAGCGSSTDSNRFLDPEQIRYYPGLDIDLARMTKTESGLYYEDLVVGTGAGIASGDLIRVHYDGWLPDGTRFDSSRARGTPLEYTHGIGQVIAGWDELLADMLVGGRRKAVIPPHLAYGAQRRGAIPPNTTLVFDVELVARVSTAQ